MSTCERLCSQTIYLASIKNGVQKKKKKKPEYKLNNHLKLDYTEAMMKPTPVALQDKPHEEYYKKVRIYKCNILNATSINAVQVVGCARVTRCLVNIIF